MTARNTAVLFGVETPLPAFLQGFILPYAFFCVLRESLGQFRREWRISKFLFGPGSKPNLNVKPLNWSWVWFPRKHKSFSSWLCANTITLERKKKPQTATQTRAIARQPSSAQDSAQERKHLIIKVANKSLNTYIATWSKVNRCPSTTEELETVDWIEAHRCKGKRYKHTASLGSRVDTLTTSDIRFSSQKLLALLLSEVKGQQTALHLPLHSSDTNRLRKIWQSFSLVN